MAMDTMSILNHKAPGLVYHLPQEEPIQQCLIAMEGTGWFLRMSPLVSVVKCCLLA